MFTKAPRLLIAPLLTLSATGAMLALGTAAAGAERTRDDAKAAVCKLDGRKRTLADSARYVTHDLPRGAVIMCPTPGAPPKRPTVPITVPITGPLTTVSNAAFLAAAAGPARTSQREFKVPASVTLAQAILESGWGKSMLSMNDRNYFGMKCFGNPGTIATGCHDYLTQESSAVTLTCWTTTAKFRVYKSPTDSFRDHGLQLATLTRYAAAFKYPTNPNQFAAEVHKAGYATDAAYTTKLGGIMVKYNLYQYDLP